MNTKVIFSSQTDEWATPQWLFDELDAEFHFDLDPCATDENHKCAEYFTKETDGLQKNWGGGQCIVIPHTEDRLEVGSRSRMRKYRNQTLLWSCFFLRGQTRSGFTITSTIKQKYGLSKGVCASEMARETHRSHQWW